MRKQEWICKCGKRSSVLISTEEDEPVEVLARVFENHGNVSPQCENMPKLLIDENDREAIILARQINEMFFPGMPLHLGTNALDSIGQ